MYVLGLTGSIAMGKSWAASCFRRLGVPVHDADGCVHALLEPGGAACASVAAAFPGVLNGQGGVDRQKLGARVFGDGAGGLSTLEAMLHPLVRDSQFAFLSRQARAGAGLVVLDVPLLYETGARDSVDAVAVVSAPAWLQRRRALRRRGMTKRKFAAILARQVADAEKRRLADFVVATGLRRGDSMRRVAEIVATARTRTGEAWGPGWRKRRKRTE